MEKQYREIEFGIGGKIDNAIDELNEYKDKGELVFGVFNGQKLYSDVDDIDSAYVKITGKTRAEFDVEMKRQNDEYKEKERQHELAIPHLTVEYIDKGRQILDEEYHQLWEECVPIRLDDLYRGFELQCCLDIVKELNAGKEFSEIKPILDEQGHSGMSFSLLCSMLRSFAIRGNEFVEFVRN